MPADDLHVVVLANSDSPASSPGLVAFRLAALALGDRSLRGGRRSRTARSCWGRASCRSSRRSRGRSPTGSGTRLCGCGPGPAGRTAGRKRSGCRRRGRPGRRGGRAGSGARRVAAQGYRSVWDPCALSGIWLSRPLRRRNGPTLGHPAVLVKPYPSCAGNDDPALGSCDGRADERARFATRSGPACRSLPAVSAR